MLTRTPLAAVKWHRSKARLRADRGEPRGCEELPDQQGAVGPITSSAFLLRAVGTSAQIDATFDTAIDNYRAANGTAFFSNTAAASLPKTLASAVLGVVGLTNTVRLQPMAQVAGTSAAGHSSEPSCEVPYPQTLAQLQAITAPGQPFNGYGGGPGCSGLTPSQTNSLYNAPHVGPRGQGAGANVAVFELSAYTASDITNWAHTFYGPSYNPPLKNINVDGGQSHRPPARAPRATHASTGMAVTSRSRRTSKKDLQIAPDVNQLLVYNSPNDFTGQTELDQYTAIANQDKANSISSSWGLCEPDAGLGYAEAENLVFEQMAAQGQSMFASSGDTGAFECIRDGTFGDFAPLQSLDPASQPWVTSVGGTSFESFDPGSNPHPHYPNGVEAVWNTLDVCSGASATGISELRRVRRRRRRAQHLLADARLPARLRRHQQGHGLRVGQLLRWRRLVKHAVRNPTSRLMLIHSPDTRNTARVDHRPLGRQPTGIPYTSACITISPATPGAPGWFHIGGTSLSAPLMAAVAA